MKANITNVIQNDKRTISFSQIINLATLIWTDASCNHVCWILGITVCSYKRFRTNLCYWESLVPKITWLKMVRHSTSHCLRTDLHISQFDLWEGEWPPLLWIDVRHIKQTSHAWPVIHGFNNQPIAMLQSRPPAGRPSTIWLAMWHFNWVRRKQFSVIIFHN